MVFQQVGEKEVRPVCAGSSLCVLRTPRQRRGWTCRDKAQEQRLCRIF